MWAWITWGIVAAGVVLVVISVMSLSQRLRPLRRALRRLSWRGEQVERLQTRAEALQERIEELGLLAGEISARRREETAQSRNP